jgi:hypothetical protein
MIPNEINACGNEGCWPERIPFLVISNPVFKRLRQGIRKGEEHKPQVIVFFFH